MQKARSQPRQGSPPGRPPTACRRVVSGSLSLPARGCFSPVPHGTRPLSVTRESFALEGGPPSFTPDSSSRALLRNSTTPTGGRHLPGCHRLWPPVPGEFDWLQSTRPWVLQPRGTKVPRFGLGPFRSPLLRASRLIPLPPGTEMFQFPGFASPYGDDGAHAPPGSPIRPSRAHSLCAAPPSLSQLTAAFLAFVCPGIPHTPSLA